MTKLLKDSLKKFRRVDEPLEILGTLGASIGGDKLVEVPNRPPFVYVQLRNNQNELIQAFNDKVSPVYNLPVIVVREGNRYIIKGRDTQRYSDWQSYSPFLPRHGDQHSFNEMGGGGDIVWVYGKQFMPMLVTPSGSKGGPNVILDPYVIQTQLGNWLYAGATGTANITQYKPTGSTAIMVLVYVNQNDGNPYLIINSGTHFSNTLTGTSQIVPYLPSVTNAAWLPAFAVRLVSGTNAIGWDNLYDVRQFYHGLSPSGTTGGTTVDVQDEGVAQGSASTFNFVGAGVTASVAGGLATINIPGGGSSSGVYKNPGSVLFAGADGYPDEDNLRLYWDNTNHIFRVGPPSPSALLTSSTLNNQNVAVSQNTAATYAAVTYGTGTSGSPAPVFAGYRMRGTPSAPLPVQDNDSLQLTVGAGYDGSNFINSARIRMSTWGEWSALGATQGSKIEFEVTPSGTASRNIFASMRDKTFNVSGTVNIPTGETYNINGSPHTHSQSIALITDTTLASPTGSFVFSGIPQTYKYLELQYNLRSDRAGATADGALLRINGLSTSIYDYLLGYFLNGAAVVGQQHAYAGSSIFLTYATAATAPTGTFVSGYCTFNDYANTLYIKIGQSRSVGLYAFGSANDGNMNVYDCHMTFRTQNGISQIQLLPNLGSNWVTGCRATLYGIS